MTINGAHVFPPQNSAFTDTICQSFLMFPFYSTEKNDFEILGQDPPLGLILREKPTFLDRKPCSWIKFFSQLFYSFKMLLGNTNFALRSTQQ